MAEADFEYWMDENSRRSAALNRLAAHVDPDEVDVATRGVDEPTVLTLTYDAPDAETPRVWGEHLSMLLNELRAVAEYANADGVEVQSFGAETRITLRFDWHEDDDGVGDDALDSTKYAAWNTVEDLEEGWYTTTDGCGCIGCEDDDWTFGVTD